MRDARQEITMLRQGPHISCDICVLQIAAARRGAGCRPATPPQFLEERIMEDGEKEIKQYISHKKVAQPSQQDLELELCVTNTARLHTWAHLEGTRRVKERCDIVII